MQKIDATRMLYRFIFSIADNAEYREMKGIRVIFHVIFLDSF